MTVASEHARRLEIAIKALNLIASHDTLPPKKWTQDTDISNWAIRTARAALRKMDKEAKPCHR
jgi:hypothetical protein